MSRLACAFQYNEYEGWWPDEGSFVGTQADVINWALERKWHVYICVLFNNEWRLVLDVFQGVVQCKDEPEYACLAWIVGSMREKFYVGYEAVGDKAIEGSSPTNFRIDEFELITVEEAIERVE